jgi:hypothetical protein
MVDSGPGAETSRPPATPAAAGPPSPAAALLPLGLIAALIAWFAWERGAYFGITLLPGTIGLLGLLVALLLFAPLPVRLRGPGLVCLVALGGIALLTLISATWSPAPDIAIEDAQRVLAYAVSFVLGLWLCSLLSSRVLLALAPLALAGAVVGIATLIAIAVSDSSTELLEIDATLRYPVGYRNAVAGFFLMAMFPMVVLAAARDELDWRLRGLLLGSATLAIELAVLSQSRTSVFALAAGVAVLVAAHPARLRILGWLTLAALPVLPALPWVLDVFQTEGGNTEASLDPLRSAAAAIAFTSAVSVVIGALAAWRDPLIKLSEERGRLLGRVLAGAFAVAVVAGTIAVVASGGGPREFIDKQTDELTAGTPDLSSKGSRFGLNLSSDRGDFWRVAIDDLESNPAGGVGAGGWRFSYLRDRESTLQPEDPHSVIMLMASELGVPGLLLFGVFVVAGTWAALRSRRRGPQAAALVAGALSVAGYWLVHASGEWFWSYAVITLPMAFVLGAAAAPALHNPGGGPRRGVRIGFAVAAAVAALSLLPFFFSERYTNEGIRSAGADPEGAYEDLDRAADLNPFTDRALAAEAVIADRNGDRTRALAALDEAEDRQPDEWTLYYLRAQVLASSDPQGANRALQRARELNPRGEEIAVLADEIATQK